MTPIGRDRLLTASVVIGGVIASALISVLFVEAGLACAYLVAIGVALLCAMRVGWWLHTWTWAKGRTPGRDEDDGPPGDA